MDLFLLFKLCFLLKLINPFNFKDYSVMFLFKFAVTFKLKFILLEMHSF